MDYPHNFPFRCDGFRPLQYIAAEPVQHRHQVNPAHNRQHLLRSRGIGKRSLSIPIRLFGVSQAMKLLRGT